MFSVITATKDSFPNIRFLAESLRNQSSDEFFWIIIDGGSKDGTLEYLYTIKNENMLVISESDFGIYDAINKGIKNCITDYYVIVGSDDILFVDAVKTINEIINKEDFDVLNFSLIVNKKIRRVNKKKPVWFYGHKALITEHSVATIFRKDLHKKLGLYSSKYSIAADMDFVLKNYLADSKFLYDNHIIGRYGIDGVSSTQHLFVICQQVNVMVELGFNKFIQLILLIIRIIRLILK